MSTDFWVGVLAGVVAAFILSFVATMAIFTILQRLAQRADMAEERVWTTYDEHGWEQRREDAA